MLVGIIINSLILPISREGHHCLVSVPAPQASHLVRWYKRMYSLRQFKQERSIFYQDVFIASCKTSVKRKVGKCASYRKKVHTRP